MEMEEGQVVAITVLDHMAGSDVTEPSTYTVYGRVAEVHSSYVVLHTWECSSGEGDHECAVLLRSVVLGHEVLK